MLMIGNLIPWRSKSDESERENSPITRFHSEVDRLFDRFFDEPFSGLSLLPETGLGRSGWLPTLEISEDEKAFTVKAEIPGVDPDDLDISVRGDVLELSGQKKEESEERRKGYFHSERRYGSFRRAIPLPSPVDQDAITAEYDRGVLSVRLPKAEKAMAKRIPVSARKK